MPDWTTRRHPVVGNITKEKAEAEEEGEECDLLDQRSPRKYVTRIKRCTNAHTHAFTFTFTWQHTYL